MALLLSAAALAAPSTAVAQAERPDVRTGGASAVAQTTATLNGTVDPNGAETTYFFEIGISRDYTSRTTPRSAGNGDKRIKVSAPVEQLQPFTRYHYRLVARNRRGTQRGDDRVFRSSREPFGLVLGANPATVEVNGSTVLSGALSGTGNGGQQVVLQSNPFPYTQGFLATGNALVTNADGSFAFPVLAVPFNTQFRVQMPEKPDVASPIVLVGVRPRVSTRAPRRVRRGRRATFRGRITPAVDGTQVLIQRRVDGLWTTVAQTVARHRGDGSSSSYRKRVRIRRTGRYRVFANVTNGQYVPDVGRELRIRARKKSP
jgi:hypothetical protein